MRRYQQGMGMLPAVCLLGIIILLGTCAVRLAPIYLDYWTLSNIIKNVVEDNAGKERSPAQIRTALGRHFTTNRIESISLRDIKISTEKEGILIDSSHEKRTRLFMNVDAVVKFENMTFMVPRD